MGNLRLLYFKRVNAMKLSKNVCLFSNVNKTFTLLILITLTGLALAAKQPPSIKDSASEPIKYVGSEQTAKEFYHGGLYQAVGVHRYQAFRANRTNPTEPGTSGTLARNEPILPAMVGWTYNHQSYLAYWNNTFYLQYLSDLRQEHEPPSRTLIMTSKDGRKWSDPIVVFPEYPLPQIDVIYQGRNVTIPAGMYSIMHQRMGFYVAPNGRLLTSAYYSYCYTLKKSPNTGKGVGRVVREIYKDGSLGPIYFIRYNRRGGKGFISLTYEGKQYKDWNEDNTLYPFYKESDDKGFVEVCEALLADKLMTLQWWEEDRAEDDGFYTVPPTRIKEGLEYIATTYCHRPDGVVLATWKRQWSALSPDDGLTWTEPVRSPTLKTTGAKVWLERTDDGRYAIVYNHSATRKNRFPMAVMTGEDGHTFDKLLCLSGEVPPIRFQGFHKDIGLQYPRGIAEGNGNPPGNQMWNTWSVNKEDIWVSRTHLPISGTVNKHVNQDFNSAKTVADLELWNIYIPTWAPISIVTDPKNDKNKCLQLCDEEPYDYALAERIFPESRKLNIEFRVFVSKVGQAVLRVEVQGTRGQRSIRMKIEPQWLWTRGYFLPIKERTWIDIALKIDCTVHSYDMAINGEWVVKNTHFDEKVDTLQRLVFRTGPSRDLVPPLIIDRERSPGYHGEDLAGADLRTPLSVYMVDDVKTKQLL